MIKPTEKICDTPIDLVTAIGRLLSDSDSRLQFHDDPAQLASRINVSPASLEGFLNLNIDQIEQQAMTLLNKRWHEVACLLPKTVNELGDHARDLFMFYANHHWPDNHRRHPVDACQFLHFLKKNKLHNPSGRELKRVQKMRMPK